MDIWLRFGFLTWHFPNNQWKWICFSRQFWWICQTFIIHYPYSGSSVLTYSCLGVHNSLKVHLNYPVSILKKNGEYMLFPLVVTYFTVKFQRHFFFWKVPETFRLHSFRYFELHHLHTLFCLKHMNVLLVIWCILYHCGQMAKPTLNSGSHHCRTIDFRFGILILDSRRCSVSSSCEESPPLCLVIISPKF